MISAYYVCNGCGKMTEYAGKNDRQLNILGVDLTNYLLFTSGFKMEKPQMDLHFCDPCFEKIQEGAARVQQYGDTQVMREKIETLEKSVQYQKDRLAEYKREVYILLSQVKQ